MLIYFHFIEILFPELSLSYNRSTLHSDTNSIFGSQLAVDGGGEPRENWNSMRWKFCFLNKHFLSDISTCSVSNGKVRWWQVQIKQSKVNKIGLNLPPKTQQHFSIFVIQLLEGNQAMFKPCSSFNDLTLDSFVMFECNSEDNEGLLGEFIYIRDERTDENLEFKLCEVQIFSKEGNLLVYGRHL